jgi:hypothetical protein
VTRIRPTGLTTSESAVGKRFSSDPGVAPPGSSPNHSDVPPILAGPSACRHTTHKLHNVGKPSVYGRFGLCACLRAAEVRDVVSVQWRDGRGRGREIRPGVHHRRTTPFVNEQSFSPTAATLLASALRCSSDACSLIPGRSSGPAGCRGPRPAGTEATAGPARERRSRFRRRLRLGYSRSGDARPRRHRIGSGRRAVQKGSHEQQEHSGARRSRPTPSSGEVDRAAADGTWGISWHGMTCYLTPS